MTRWIAFLLIAGSLLVITLGASTPSTAQSPVIATAAAGTPVLGARVVGPTRTTDERSLPTLILTLRDNGRTFTIPVGAQILLQIPRMPASRLVYDPAILRLLPYGPLPPVPGGGVQPQDQSTPEPSSSIYPIGWRLVAIGPGTSPLALAPEPYPCLTPPCPMGVPSINFRVTIIVSGAVYPPYPPPVVTPYRSGKYIGTANLRQTVAVQVGQVVILDLPFLTSQQPVQLLFDSGMLQLLPGQSVNYLPPGGWHFVVAQPGTSSLIVQGKTCLDGGVDCGTVVLFQVTLTTAS
jgi:hypothetical protein